MPGQAQPPLGIKSAPCPLSSPGGAALARAYGLPRPSGNVSAMVRPPTPAVSVSRVTTLKAGRADRRPGKAQPPPGEIKDTVPDILPGGAALARAYGV